MAQSAKSYDIPKFKEQYDNFTGAECAAPVNSQYFAVDSPLTARFLQIVRLENC